MEQNSITFTVIKVSGLSCSSLYAINCSTPMTVMVMMVNEISEVIVAKVQYQISGVDGKWSFYVRDASLVTGGVRRDVKNEMTWKERAGVACAVRLSTASRPAHSSPNNQF